MHNLSEKSDVKSTSRTIF